MTDARRQPRLAPGAAPLSVYLVVFLVLPVGVLLLFSLWEAGFHTVVRELTLENYGRVFTEPLYLRLLGKSLLVGLVVASVTIPISFLVAYAITFRFPNSGNRLLLLVMVSMLASYIVRIYAWKTILGPSGVINQGLMSIGAVDQPVGWLLYGNTALAIALTHILIPYSVLPIYSALQNVDRDTLTAARDLGAGSGYAFWTVTLPLALPGVTVAFLFCFILAAADYVTPQLVGGTEGILIGRVIADQFGAAGNRPFGATLSAAMLVGFALTMGGLLGIKALNRRRPRLPRLSSHQLGVAPGRVRRWLSSLPIVEAMTALVIAFLYLPLFVVMLFSFNSSTRGILPIEGLTLRWYREAFQSSAFLGALRSSLLVACGSVAVALGLGIPAAFALVRRRFQAESVLRVLITGPIAVPGVVIGVAILSALALIGRSGGLAATTAAHALFTVPFVVFVVRARLTDFDMQVEEAARDLGSSRARTLRTVTLPLIQGSLVGAGILVFALSIDEFIITNFVVGANATLPVMIWSQMRTGIAPSVNAIASVILVGTLGLIAVAGLIVSRSGRSSLAADLAASERSWDTHRFPPEGLLDEDHHRRGAPVPSAGPSGVPLGRAPRVVGWLRPDPDHDG